MSKSIRCSLLLIFCAATAGVISAQAQTAAEKAFSAIKSLPGAWEGKTEDGPVKVNFKLTAGGSAVMSEIVGKEEMMSIFHLDGPNRLLMTHYCPIGNQPRFQASASPDGKTITFNFLDAMSLGAPDAGHIQTMVLTLVDDNHHTEEWTFMQGDKPVRAHMDLQRTK